MTEPTVDRRLTAFFEEGPATLSPRLAQAVMGDVRHTGQVSRRAFNRNLRRFAPVLVVAAVVAVIGVALAASGIRRPERNVGATPPPVVQSGWMGPVRTDAAALPTVPSDRVPRAGGIWGLSDADDAARPYVDIDQIARNSSGQRHWWVWLNGAPPKAETLDPSQTVLSYGLTFDTDDDGTADYVVGLSNEGPTPGDFRAWVTNLDTGVTEEQLGPPYGYPVEFSLPDEASGDGLNPPTVLFTFLPGTNPGLGSGRFYAWASVTQNGDVVAWDYAPDAGWLVQSRAD